MLGGPPEMGGGALFVGLDVYGSQYAVGAMAPRLQYAAAARPNYPIGVTSPWYPSGSTSPWSPSGSTNRDFVLVGPSRGVNPSRLDPCREPFRTGAERDAFDRGLFLQGKGKLPADARGGRWQTPWGS